jgi:Acetyltransferase (GNAT) domain
VDFKEFISQESKIRDGVHLNDGVWWQKTSPGSCLPLFQMQQIVAQESRPSLKNSFARYRHLTKDDCKKNSSMSFMIIPGEKLNDFGFITLPHEKRKAINRAKKNGIEVHRLETIEEHWSSLRDVFISTSRRTKYGLSESYYRENESDWRQGFRKEFELNGRDWFAAFCGKKIVGFLYSCIVDGRAFLLVTKFDDSYRDSRPSDALHYHVLSYYRDNPQCFDVCAGQSSPNVESIDRFKRRFGFESVEYPAFQWLSLPVRAVLGWALPCSAFALKWQSAESKRNLRYKIEVLRRTILNS